MKIVLNRSFGAFNLSEEAIDYLGCSISKDYSAIDDRSNKKLVECVENLKEKASGKYSELHVATIPDDATDWRLFEYDGLETVIYVKDGKMEDIKIDDYIQ